MSVDTQIIGGFSIQAIGMTLIPVLANIGNDAGYWSVFGTMFIQGWFSGVVQGCAYRENAKLPGEYIGIFLTSQGLAGIISNLLRFATLEIWPDDPFVSASVNFLFGVLCSIICIPAQLQIKKNRFARYY